MSARAVSISTSPRLERLDTFGAWLIERLKRTFLLRGLAARITGLSEIDRGLIEDLRLVNQAPAPRRPRRTAFCWRWMPLAAASPKSAGRSCCWCKCSAR
jgi:hypothetical protein